MRFFNCDGELDGRTFARSYGTEAAMVLSAFDCALNGRRAVYVSSELTTGERFWQLAREHRVSNLEELRAVLGAEGVDRLLWQPNVEAANRFGRQVEQRLGRLVLTPAPFLAPDWSQAEYLAFWETLIRTRVDAAHFNRGWELSNGCTFELAVALDAGIPAWDHEGSPLDLETGIARVRAALARLRDWGIDAPGLRAGLARLEALRPRQAAAADRLLSGRAS